MQHCDYWHYECAFHHVQCFICLPSTWSQQLSPVMSLLQTVNGVWSVEPSAKCYLVARVLVQCWTSGFLSVCQLWCDEFVQCLELWENDDHKFWLVPVKQLMAVLFCQLIHDNTSVVIVSLSLAITTTAYICSCADYGGLHQISLFSRGIVENRCVSVSVQADRQTDQWS